MSNPFPELQFPWEGTGMEDIRYKEITCARCHQTGICTPSNEYYESPMWPGKGRICEMCLRVLARSYQRTVGE